MLDGFKRLAAVRSMPEVTSLEARVLNVDERIAKVTILGLNGTGRRMKELEEAWIVHALVREDGLSQVEVAELLGRHKSWVCRRLALLERLAEQCREDLRLGLGAVLTAAIGDSIVDYDDLAVVAQIDTTLERSQLGIANGSGGRRPVPPSCFVKVAILARSNVGALPLWPVESFDTFAALVD